MVLCVYVARYWVSMIRWWIKWDFHRSDFFFWFHLPLKPWFLAFPVPIKKNFVKERGKDEKRRSPWYRFEEKVNDKDSKKASQNTFKLTVPLQVAFQSRRWDAFFCSCFTLQRVKGSRKRSVCFHSPATSKESTFFTMPLRSGIWMT